MRQDEADARAKGRLYEAFGPCPCGCGEPRRPYRDTASDQCPPSKEPET